MFCYVIHHISLVFDRKLIANDFKFKYLMDMLETIVDVIIKDKEESIKYMK